MLWYSSSNLIYGTAPSSPSSVLQRDEHSLGAMLMHAENINHKGYRYNGVDTIKFWPGSRSISLPVVFCLLLTIPTSKPAWQSLWRQPVRVHQKWPLDATCQTDRAYNQPDSAHLSDRRIDSGKCENEKRNHTASRCLMGGPEDDGGCTTSSWHRDWPEGKQTLLNEELVHVWNIKMHSDSIIFCLEYGYQAFKD